MRFATLGSDDIAPRHRGESGALAAPAQLTLAPLGTIQTPSFAQLPNGLERRD